MGLCALHDAVGITGRLIDSAALKCRDVLLLLLDGCPLGHCLQVMSQSCEQPCTGLRRRY